MSLTDNRMRLVSALHLQVDPDGTANIVDDRTFVGAHVNITARILLEALREPRTYDELQTVLMRAADCPKSETVAPVARLVEELMEYGWIESDEAP